MKPFDAQRAEHLLLLLAYDRAEREHDAGAPVRLDETKLAQKLVRIDGDPRWLQDDTHEVYEIAEMVARMVEAEFPPIRVPLDPVKLVSPMFDFDPSEDTAHRRARGWAEEQGYTVVA